MSNVFIHGMDASNNIVGLKCDTEGQILTKTVSSAEAPLYVNVNGANFVDEKLKVDIGGQSVVVNTISGYALNSSVSTTNTKLDTLTTAVADKHLNKLVDSVDISGQTVALSNFGNITHTEGTIKTGLDVNIMNELPIAVTTELTNYAQETGNLATINSNSTAANLKLDNIYSELQTIHGDVSNLTYDTANNLKVNLAAGSLTISAVDSKLQDGLGNLITSTYTTLGGGKQCLDVNLPDAIKIYTSAPTNPLDCQDSDTHTKLDTLHTDLSTNIGVKFDTSNTLATGANTKLDSVITNTLTVNTTLTNLINTSLSGIAGSASSSNTKLDTTNSHLDSVKTNTAGTTTALTSTNTKLDTLHTDITTTNTTLAVGFGKFPDDITSKTITYPNVTGADNTNAGLRMYQIQPKVNMYMVQGTDVSTNTYCILGGTGANGWTYTTFNFGSNDLRSFYGITSTGSKTVIIEYVDNNGDLQITPSKTLSTTSGTTLLFTNAIGINKVSLDDATPNQNINTGTLSISSTSGALSNVHCQMNVSYNLHTSYTCPNNKIAYLKELKYYSQTTAGAPVVSILNAFINSKNGNRRCVKRWDLIANENYTDLNILITPGETLFFGCPYNGTSNIRDVNAIVLQYDL